MSDLEGDSDLLASDSSEDDDLELRLLSVKKKKENFLEALVSQYDDQQFFEHFRINREVAQSLAEKYEKSDQYSKHSGPYGQFSALTQIYIFLRFIGHQTSNFRHVAKRFNITISSLHRIIRRVVVFLSNLSPQVITWPTEDEKKEAAQYFEENGFPGVIGIIDGCHVKIDKPENDPETYMNRKSFYSVQMQVVCDHTRKILDIFMGFPGSVPDGRVFRNSPLCNHLEEKCGDYFLLGDSDYPLEKNLMTPFKGRVQLTERQNHYNMTLSKNHYVIHQCFAILKQKFKQLFHVKLRDISIIVHLIRAACVLHNLSLNDEFVLSENIEIWDEVLPPLELDEEEDNDDAKLIRDQLVNLIPM